MVPGVVAESVSKVAKTPDPSIHVSSAASSKPLPDNENQRNEKKRNI
jgi:hypothetical protein